MTARWRWLGAAIVTAVVASVLLVSYDNRPSELVALPPAKAAPEQVLRVYLRAATAHDCATTEALTTAVGDMRSMAFCGRSWQPLGIGHPDLVSYSGIGPAEHLSAHAIGGTPQVCIPVDIDTRNMTGSEHDELPGWEFCFEHQAAGWRIVDWGYG